VRDYRDTVVSNPGAMMGKPVIVGTRITVESILEKPAARESVDRIPDAHPRLNEDAVRAAPADVPNIPAIPTRNGRPTTPPPRTASPLRHHIIP
jgi:uncharacterized protein (DUF433 family)